MACQKSLSPCFAVSFVRALGVVLLLGLGLSGDPALARQIAKAAETETRAPKEAPAKKAKAHKTKTDKAKARKAAPKEAKAKAKAKAGEAEEVGFFEKYYPLAMDDELHPDLEDNWVWFFVAGALAEVGGHIWVPMLAADLDFPDGYLEDALFILAAKAAPHVALFALFLPATALFIIPPVGFVAFIIAWGLNAFVNIPTALVDIFYFAPVALVNAYNRRAKEQGMTLVDDDGKRKKRRRSLKDRLAKKDAPSAGRLDVDDDGEGLWPGETRRTEVVVYDETGCIRDAEVRRDLEAMLPADADRRELRLEVTVTKTKKGREVAVDLLEGKEGDRLMSRKVSITKDECKEVPRLVSRMVRAHL